MGVKNKDGHGDHLSFVPEEDGHSSSTGLAHRIKLGGPRRRWRLSVGEACSHYKRRSGSRASSGWRQRWWRHNVERLLVGAGREQLGGAQRGQHGGGGVELQNRG
jgi:hypothetical protein